jgi:CTD small phosphatase-like protein 2
VDNNPQSFAFQIDNGIPISSYFGDDHNDDSLLELTDYLRAMAKIDNI